MILKVVFGSGNVVKIRKDSCLKKKENSSPRQASCFLSAPLYERNDSPLKEVFHLLDFTSKNKSCQVFGDFALDRHRITSHRYASPSIEKNNLDFDNFLPEFDDEIHKNEEQSPHIGCGGNKYVTLYCASCGHERQVIITCRDRTCPFCREKQYRRLIARYKPLLKELPVSKLALMTLTTRIKPGNLKTQVKQVRKAWQKLIRQQIFKPAVGGLYSIEVKKSETYKAWNVHIHALIETYTGLRVWTLKGRKKADLLGQGKILTWQALGQAWKNISGGSYIVDIAPIFSPIGGLKYLLKYMLKSPVLTYDERNEYNAALYNTRLIQTFGSWYPTSKNYRFDSKPLKLVPLACPVCDGIGWLSEFFLIKNLGTWRKTHQLSFKEVAFW